MEESKPKLTMYVDKADVYEDDYLVATFAIFDSESYTLTIDNKLVTPDNLREMADILAKLQKELTT